MAEEKSQGSELDLLMSLDPLNTSEQDFDQIIAYERQARLEFELGVKAPKKDKGVTFDMNKVLSALAPAAVVPQSTPGKRRLV